MKEKAVSEQGIVVEAVREIEHFRYLKSYQIDYRTKGGKPAVWELASRGSKDRLEAEIFGEENFSDGTVIFATNRERSHVVLLKEFRVSAGRYVYMLPAGLADEQEPIFETAMREFREETGLTLEPVSFDPPRYVSIGIVNEKVSVVYGYYQGEVSTSHQTEEEDAEVCLVDSDMAKALLETEEFCIRTALLLKQFFDIPMF